MAAPELNAQKGFKTLVFSKAAAGDNNLIPGVDGERIYVLGLSLSANGGGNTAMLQETGTAIAVSPTWVLAANGLAPLPITPPTRYWCRTTEGAGLDINLTAATAVTGVLVYQQFGEPGA